MNSSCKILFVWCLTSVSAVLSGQEDASQHSLSGKVDSIYFWSALMAPMVHDEIRISDDIDSDVKRWSEALADEERKCLQAAVTVRCPKASRASPITRTLKTRGIPAGVVLGWIAELHAARIEFRVGHIVIMAANDLPPMEYFWIAISEEFLALVRGDTTLRKERSDDASLISDISDAFAKNSHFSRLVVCDFDEKQRRVKVRGRPEDIAELERTLATGFLDLRRRDLDDRIHATK